MYNDSENTGIIEDRICDHREINENNHQIIQEESSCNTFTRKKLPKRRLQPVLSSGNLRQHILEGKIIYSEEDAIVSNIFINFRKKRRI